MLTVTVMQRSTDPSTGGTVLAVNVLDLDPALLGKTMQQGTRELVTVAATASDDVVRAILAAKYPTATVYLSVEERRADLLRPLLLARGLAV